MDTKENNKRGLKAVGRRAAGSYGCPKKAGKRFGHKAVRKSLQKEADKLSREATHAELMNAFS